MTTFPFPTVQAELDRVLRVSPVIYCEIGARKGGRRFRDIGRYVRYYGFEPSEPEAVRLAASLRGVFADVHVLQHAVMENDGPVRINVARHRGCSSALTPDIDVVSLFSTRRGDTADWRKYLEIVETYECEARSLDSVAADLAIDGIDFLAVDTQGSELMILQGGSRVVARTALVEVEMGMVAFYRGQPVLPGVVAWMSSAGFRLLDIENMQYLSRWPAAGDNLIDKGELVQLDGLFYRDDDAAAPAHGDAASVLRRMLVLYSLGHLSLAIDSGRRFLLLHEDPVVVLLTDAMIERFEADNWKAQPTWAKARRRLRKLMPARK